MCVRVIIIIIIIYSRMYIYIREFNVEGERWWLRYTYIYICRYIVMFASHAVEVFVCGGAVMNADGGSLQGEWDGYRVVERILMKPICVVFREDGTRWDVPNTSGRGSEEDYTKSLYSLPRILAYTTKMHIAIVFIPRKGPLLFYPPRGDCF